MRLKIKTGVYSVNLVIEAWCCFSWCQVALSPLNIEVGYRWKQSALDAGVLF